MKKNCLLFVVLLVIALFYTLQVEGVKIQELQRIEEGEKADELPVNENEEPIVQNERRQVSSDNAGGVNIGNINVGVNGGSAANSTATITTTITTTSGLLPTTTITGSFNCESADCGQFNGPCVQSSAGAFCMNAPTTPCVCDNPNDCATPVAPPGQTVAGACPAFPGTPFNGFCNLVPGFSNGLCSVATQFGTAAPCSCGNNFAFCATNGGCAGTGCCCGFPFPSPNSLDGYGGCHCGHAYCQFPVAQRCSTAITVCPVSPGAIPTAGPAAVPTCNVDPNITLAGMRVGICMNPTLGGITLQCSCSP